MHSATTATGRPLPPPGKTLPKNRPAPPSCRATHQLAAPKPHVTSQLQCYIPARIDNHCRSPRRTHSKFNRQPVRLEIAISPTKQTPAPQFNRQLFATPRIANPVLSHRQTSQDAPRTTDRQSRITSHHSLITNHRLSNRHTPRLENAKNPTKSQLSRVLIVTFLRYSRPESRVTNRAVSLDASLAPHQSLLTNHQSRLTAFNRTPSAAHSAPRPLVPPQYPPVRNSPRALAHPPIRATSPAALRALKHPQSPPETSSAAYIQSPHSRPDNHPAPAKPRRTARSLPPTKPPRNCATPVFPSPASTPNAPNPPGARGSVPASASSPPRGTPQTPAAPLAKSSRRDRRA